MKVARLPDDEGERLAALRGTGLLDSLPEAEFDDLTRLASLICQTPIALISLIDEHRQWFKSRVGLAAPETPRDFAFCAHAILQREVFIIGDALLDERFRDNPLVVGDPHVRFYAGAVLCNDGGQPLGTLCVIDHVPRTLDANQTAALAALSRAVIARIELRRAKQDVDDFLENALDLVQSVDEQGRFVYVNRAWRDTLGFDARDLERITLFDIIVPEHHQSCREQFQRVHVGEKLGNIETEFITKAGRSVPVEGTSRVARDAHGRLTTRSVFRDITARKLAEEQLRASEAEFRLLAEHAPIGIFRSDPRGRCTYTNPRWRELAGLSEAQALGDGVTLSVHAEDRQRIAAALASASAAPFSETFRMQRPSGEVSWVHSRAVALRNERGDFCGLLGSAEDITGLRLATDALQESSSFQRALLDAASLIIISTDAEGRVRSVNATAQAMLGYTADELIGKPPPDALHDRQEIAARARALSTELGRRVEPGFEVLVAKARDEKVDENEWSYVRKDGSRFPVRLTVSAVHDQQRRLIGFLIVGKDITEERRAIAAQQELVRLKNEFVATVSHELRTPLTSIRGALSLLRSGVVDRTTGKGDELLHIAFNNSERLIRLVNDILDLEKIDAGKLELHCQDIAAAAIVEGAVSNTSPMAATVGVALSVTIDGDPRLFGDEDRLVQVLTNLLSNAVKFTPAGGTVRVAVFREGFAIRFDVVDQGPGIAKESQPTLFERFRQLDASDARRNAGTGLGLAICKAIVSEHGGEVGLTSALGLGSTFWFKIPARR